VSDPLDTFESFAAAVRGRLDAGRIAYSDRSFDADPGVLLAELQQEALDLAGWGFILFERLERRWRPHADGLPTRHSRASPVRQLRRRG
jgi:hypothetical protein